MNKRAEEFVNSKTSELNGLAPDKLTVIKWLTDFASDQVKAINYNRCSTQLNNLKNKLSFKQWKQVNNYRLQGNDLYRWAGAEYNSTEVFEHYKTYVNKIV